MDHEVPSHRHLFNCYVYQYHLIQFATSIQGMVCENIPIFDSEEAKPILLAQRDNPAGN